jgi:hypothetical protein
MFMTIVVLLFYVGLAMSVLYSSYKIVAWIYETTFGDGDDNGENNGKK